MRSTFWAALTWFYYINAFISETVKATGVASTQLKSAGMNHLDGVQAVAYGRLRLMDTDYARTERQRKVISLAFEKMKKADWATINNIVQTVFPQVATSIEINEDRTKYYALPSDRDDRFPVGAEGKEDGTQGRLRHPADAGEQCHRAASFPVWR